MPHRLTNTALAAALLLMVAASAWAEAAGKPVHREAPRGRVVRGEGVQGLTLLRMHVGFSAPSGNLSDGFDTGLGTRLGVAYGVSRDVLLSADFGFHRFESHDGSGSMKIIPWTVGAEFVIPTTGRVHPWIGGGLGAYHLDVDQDVVVVIGGFPFVTRLSESETNPGMNFGMGVGGPLGTRTDWDAGFKLHHVFEGDRFNDLDFLTFQVGIGVRL